MLNNNIIALLITFAVALGWLRLNDFAAARGWISSELSRKIIHMGTGPLFVLCWLLYKDNQSAHFLAALVPLAITAQFFLVGSGILHDESAVKAMSRSGDRREILRGPLYYGIVFVVLTVWFWTHSPIGMVALMLMCGGDGLADILGRRLGAFRLPWNRNKSVAGSIAMFVGGFIFGFLILGVFVAARYFPGPWLNYLPAVFVIALAGTVVESLPFKDIDNITVTLTAVILGYILF
jgi:phytol kinase